MTTKRKKKKKKLCRLIVGILLIVSLLSTLFCGFVYAFTQKTITRRSNKTKNPRPQTSS